MTQNHSGHPGMAGNGRAVVLGPGGVAGTAWLAGLAAGLRREGADLAEADVIVGTSSGAIIGAMLATGQDPDQLANLPQAAHDGRTAPRVDAAKLNAVFAVQGDPTLDPDEARRRVGRLAVAADTGPEDESIARMAALIGARDWPGGRLLITAVDTGTGEPVVWNGAGGEPLPAAVAASIAAPGIYPPITIGGRRYMDGALRAGSNADLAAGARVLVMIEPLAHLFGRTPPNGHAGEVVSIVPDSAAIRSYGVDLHDRRAWESCYRAGERQAAGAAGRVRDAWLDGPSSRAPVTT